MATASRLWLFPRPEEFRRGGLDGCGVETCSYASGPDETNARWLRRRDLAASGRSTLSGQAKWMRHLTLDASCSTFPPMPRTKIRPREFASIKLSRPFVAQIKEEAARRGVPMYELVEAIVSRELRVKK